MNSDDTGGDTDANSDDTGGDTDTLLPEDVTKENGTTHIST